MKPHGSIILAKSNATLLNNYLKRRFWRCHFIERPTSVWGLTAINTEQNQEFRAEVERVTFKNDDSGYGIIRLKAPDCNQLITATGPLAGVNPGESLQLFGIWVKHPQYGRQFKVDRAVSLRPNSLEGIRKYLSSGLIKGLGEKTAERIVQEFGLRTFEILDDNPDRLCEVKNLGRKKVNGIISAWRENQSTHEIMMFLSQQGIHAGTAAKILKLYGSHTVDIVSANPYRLAAEIRGIGFAIADRIARRLGIAPDSTHRIQAAITHLLSLGEERGHCYLTLTQLETELHKLLEIESENLLSRLADCLSDLKQQGIIVEQSVHDPEIGKTTIYYNAELYYAEMSVSNQIGARLLKPMHIDTERTRMWLERYADASGVSLSEQQFAAVVKAASNRIFVLTGGPGVGKTTTANTIIRLLKAMGKGVALCAPTGRAAQRLSEVAAIPAKTIHRLLEWTPGENAFARNENNPLPAQAIVVDETSMLDIRLADALLRAVATDAQIIFIGDADQLPSVGPGSVLRDLLESTRVPYTRLSEIFRQAQTSLIIQAAHAINRGHVPEFGTGAQADCQFIQAESTQDVLTIVRDLFANKIGQNFGFDAKHDAQILTPMNRGDLGTQSLNEMLQDLLNPRTAQQSEIKARESTLRQGDKVIQCANNYDLGVFNGDIGFVRGAGVEGGKVVVQFGERLVTYDGENWGDLKLAYAITIHKSQGSEFPVVVIPLTMSHYMMLQRNLVYTGLTRAKKLAIFVGTQRALQHAIRNNVSIQRQSMLLERIRQANM